MSQKVIFNKHIPTPIGIGIVVFVLSFALAILVVSQNNQSNIIQSNAATNSPIVNTPQRANPTPAPKRPNPTPAPKTCASVYHGTCYDIYQHYCSRGYKQGYCPGPYDIQCCP